MGRPIVVRNVALVPTRLAQRRHVREQADVLVMGKRRRQHTANVVGRLVPQGLQERPSLLFAYPGQFIDRHGTGPPHHRPHRQEQLALPGPCRALAQNVGGQRLPERDGCMLERSVTFGTTRSLPINEEPIDPRPHIVAPTTIQAQHLSRRPVNLLDLPATGQLVKPIDVLCDHAIEQSLFLPACQDLVSGIGFRVGKFTNCEALLPPILYPRLLAGNEIVEVDRLIRRPDATRRPEIRDPTFGADPCTGESDR